MLKEFNITGVCVPAQHFLVNTSSKIQQIMLLIEKGKYFTINRPRQFGKTTVLYSLFLELEKNPEDIPIKISFEGIGDTAFENEENFTEIFINQLSNEFKISDNSDFVNWFQQHKNIKKLNELGYLISDFILYANKKVVLIIDEVDKSSNNRLFLNLIGLLRDKFLKKNEGRDHTFHSVILAGVHDIRNLKLKINSDEEQKLNSPWNIATEFTIDLSFNSNEISTMLLDYTDVKNININIPEFSDLIYFYTSGYPFLVSKICKIIDETILPAQKRCIWKIDDIDNAVDILVKQNNTNFESLINKLEENKDLFNLVFDLIVAGKKVEYSIHNPLLSLGLTYGFFKINGELKIHNRIYEQVLYDYLTSKIATSTKVELNGETDFFISGTELKLDNVLYRFQEFMKEQYSEKDSAFLERNGRLIFLAFLKPIISGHGFDFKEVQISDEKRLVVVITFYNKKYIVELKIWRSDEYHQKGLQQLYRYLQTQNSNKGFLVIFNNKIKKEWKHETITLQEKEIFAVWV